MIFFYDAQGNLIKSVPTNVYQGSNKASRIWFIMPTAPTNIVNVAFTLPNGQYAPQRIMTNATLGTGVIKGENKFVDETGKVINAWYYDLLTDITAYAGQTKAQFFVTTTKDKDGGNEVVATDSVDILVVKGTPSVNLPAPINEYQAIIDALTSRNADVANIEKDVGVLKDTVKRNTSDIGRIDLQVSLNKSNIESLYGTVVDNVDDIAKNTRDVEILKQENLRLSVAVEKNTTDIKALFTAELNKNVLVYENAELSEEIQQTGGADLAGYSILDYSRATVNKISGNTVKCLNLFNINEVSSGNEYGGEIVKGSDGTLTFQNFVDKASEGISQQTMMDLSFLNGLIIKPNETYTLRAKIVSMGGITSDMDLQTAGDIICGEQNHVGLISNGYWTIDILNYGSDDIIAQDLVIINAGLSPYAFNGFTISEVQFVKVENGVTPKYQPYFAGLKNAKISGIKSVGRNLIPFPYQENTKTESGVTWTPNADGSVTAKGIATNYTFFTLNHTIQVFSGKTYTFTMSEQSFLSLNMSLDFIITYKDGTEYNPQFSLLGNTITFTPEQNGRLTLIIKRRSNNVEIDATVYPRLCYGSTALPYMPYGVESTMQLPETVELGKWDYIENGQIVRQTENLVFTGNENWMLQSINENGFANFRITLSKKPHYPWNNSICNLYEYDITQIASVVRHGFLISNDYVFFRDNNYTTVDQWKAHLAELYASGKPLTFSYPLETPTYEPISFGNEYLVWDKGEEQVLTPEDENGLTCFNYGANTTEENSYYVLIGGNE